MFANVFTAGICVMVCSNLAFGGTMVIKRCHTSGLELAELVTIAMNSLENEFLITETVCKEMKIPYLKESQYHILRLVTFSGDAVNLILADKKSGDSYTFIVFDKLGKAGKYNFSFPDFVSTDFDGDGLADWRQNSTQYEIRLNDEWVSCQKILPGQRKVLLSDGTGYEFKNGKWIPAVSDK